MKKTTIKCPCCGAEIAIPEKQHLCIGMAVGEDSGLGEITLPIKKPGNPSAGAAPTAQTPSAPGSTKPKTAAERLQALRMAGVDTKGLFALQGAAGEDIFIRMKDGIPAYVGKEDPVVKRILLFGTIPERRLFRRWVTSQMFRLLESPEGFDKTVRMRGAGYQWRQVIEEYRVQSILAKNDPQGLDERQMWFNRTLAGKMTEGLVKQLKREQTRIRRVSKGLNDGHYKAFVPVSDEQMQKLEQLSDCVKRAKTPKSVHDCLLRFREACPRFNDEAVSKDWLEAYKAAGAYYTLKNLILFGGAKFQTESGEPGAGRLLGYASKLVRDGKKYLMFITLTNIMKEQHIDIAAKREEWRHAMMHFQN
jgi:hypothetical protein